jgi:hypothetical protein
VQKLAVRSMSGILDNSMAALYQETDLALAEAALASDLKLLEGLIKTDPCNKKLLLMASQGFAAYALGFVEGEDHERAKLLYQRGKFYGLQILSQDKIFKKAIAGSVENLKQALSQLAAGDVAALFWTANNWASWINLNFNNPEALVELPKVQLLMERVLELDESYFFGGAHLFFGTIYAVRPPILGGDMGKARFHFERCFVFSQNKFLLPYVYYAKHYLVRQLDEAAFVTMLTNVITTPDDILPGQELPNAMAKKMAQKLLDNKEEFF